jgi:hypothetical protein
MYRGRVHIKKSSFDKVQNCLLIHLRKYVDLYKTEDYADDLENNYALTAGNIIIKLIYLII